MHACVFQASIAEIFLVTRQRESLSSGLVPLFLHFRETKSLTFGFSVMFTGCFSYLIGTHMANQAVAADRADAPPLNRRVSAILQIREPIHR